MPKFEAGMESMLDMFVFETGDLLEKLDDILMRTEQEETIGTEDINEIFRTMHTIKGSASMMGLQNMSTLAHAVEDLFYIIRDDPEVKYDKPGLYELLFASSDNLKNELDNIQDDDIPLSDFTELEGKIHAFAAQMKGEDAPAASTAQASGGEDISHLFPDDEDETILTYRVIYQESCAMPSARGFVLLRNLGQIAEVCSTMPPDLDDDNADDEIKAHGLIIKLITDDAKKVLEYLEDGINVEKAEQLHKPDKSAAPAASAKSAPAPQAPTPAQADKAVEEAKAQESPKQQAKQAPKKPAEKHEQSLITVNLEKLDHLLDLVAEIVITQGSVTSSPDLKGLGVDLDRFNKSARELKKLTDELQDSVMSIRMVPVSTAFQKMNRVVRDMNQKLGKGVTLEFEGEDTEVDKSIVDILNDPLMHITRNAVDHGIELPEERAAAGKTEPPTVTLSAGYDSGEVVISCRDNGAGMDRAKILAKAKKNGLLTKPEGEYTDKEVYAFTVAAGFSTNEQITEYSGRGVGMDVVKKNIEKVGGKLLVDSEFGVGSVFTIRIPLSLSIIDVLSVQVGENSLSVPISSVREAFSCKAENYILDPDGNEFIMLRGMCLPLIRLNKHFGIPSDIEDVEKGIMLYCMEQDTGAVLFADTIISDQQIVVKPFSPLLSDYPLKETGMSGCSILGDGTITIALDVNELIKPFIKDSK
ncbi:MAG: chemotaxis protein CheA [Ruminococcus sp.]|nr:chemotaxis protein CheA [Ruminococcus sp.]